MEGKEIDNVILIGMPGSGKTTIGRLLSKRIGYSFMDTDILIEEKEKLTVSDMFKKKGEAYFRQKEKEVIEELKTVSRAVIATGGGMPTFFDNLAKLKEIGLTIYLRAPLEEIDKRTAVGHSRPLLTKDRRKKLEEILEARQAYYENADLIVDNYLMSAEEICEIIAYKIKNYKE